MNMEQFVDILQQLPVVGLFIWFVLKRDKEWRDVLDRLSNAIHELALKLERMNKKDD